jgi:hypothetical protein
MSDPAKKKTISELFADGTAIQEALNRAVQAALWRHKQAGNPIAAWRDGKVVWIPPEEIPVEKPPDGCPIRWIGWD